MTKHRITIDYTYGKFRMPISQLKHAQVDVFDDPWLLPDESIILTVSNLQTGTEYLRKYFHDWGEAEGEEIECKVAINKAIKKVAEKEARRV